ncbi:MAG: D-aminoacyl-tRNA deacylase [bacterium]
MKVLIQRVKEASVKVDGKLVSSINRGLLVFLGVSNTDTDKEAREIAKKVSSLRIFEDENGKMNLSLRDINGEILSISQFTLYADTSRGRRPGFEKAAPKEIAIGLWNRFNQYLKSDGFVVKEGIFGEHMEVFLINDGPVTIILEEGQ